MAALIDVDYLAALIGELADEDRADTLIDIASDLVNEELGTSYDGTTAPERAKQVVAQLVAQALTAEGSDFAVTAEQLGDKRVEYARGARSLMDLSTVEHLLSKLRPSSYSVKTLPPSDGPATTNWWAEVDEP